MQRKGGNYGTFHPGVPLLRNVLWLCLKSKSVPKRSDHCLAISTLTTGYMILNVLRVLCWKTSLKPDFNCEWFLKFNEKTLVGVVSTFYYSWGVAHRYFYLLNITQPYQILILSVILNLLRRQKTSLNDYFWSKIALYLVIWSWKIRRRVRISTSCALAEVIFLVFPIVVLSRISCILFVSLSCQKSISHSFNLVTSSCNTGFRTVSKQRHPRMKCSIVSSFSYNG
jgi:hypothetical protein